MIEDYDRNVFINCAFDTNFIDYFRALVFTVHDCGFIVRCALEVGNKYGVRINKIVKIIEQCQFSIHDLSCIEITSESPLPRFNMPYELGIFMGAKYFGSGINKKKEFLVIDQKPHRYKQLISDLAGYDFPNYTNIESLISVVRTWLAETANIKLPGPDYYLDRYKEFRDQFPALCKEMHHTTESIQFKDFYALVSVWIQQKNEELITSD